MGIFVNILVLLITFTTFIVAGGYITDSSRRITDIPEYPNNAKLSAGHSKAAWAAVICWISVALMITGVILYIIFLSETAEVTGKWLVNGLILLSLIGAITVGILAAITASDINESGVSDNKGSYKQAIIATVLALVVSFLLIVAFILKIAYKPKKKENEGGMFGLPSWLNEEINTDPELEETLL